MGEEDSFGDDINLAERLGDLPKRSSVSENARDRTHVIRVELVSLMIRHAYLIGVARDMDAALKVEIKINQLKREIANRG